MDGGVLSRKQTLHGPSLVALARFPFCRRYYTWGAKLADSLVKDTGRESNSVAESKRLNARERDETQLTPVEYLNSARAGAERSDTALVRRLPISPIG